MIFGRWGAFGRFVLLTTGIGLMTGAIWYLGFAAMSGEWFTVEELQTIPYFVGAGAGLGLLMGEPSYWTVRLCMRWIPTPAVSAVFFFVLGVASVTVPLTIGVAISGGDLALLLMIRSPEDLIGLPLLAALAGVLTAVVAPLVLRPIPDSLRRESCSGPADSGPAEADAQ